MSTTAPTPPTTRRERPTKGDRTAAAILAAAEDLFAEKGYDGTTLRDVADRVGIRIPSLYNHFESKEALYGAVLERGLGPILELLSSVVAEARASEAPWPPEPRPIVEAMLAVLDARPQLPRLLLRETLAGGTRLSPELRDWIAPIFERAGEAAARGVDEARFGADQVTHLVLAIYHVVVGYYAIAPFYKQLGGHDLLSEEARERQARFVADLVENLFSPNTSR